MYLGVKSLLSKPAKEEAKVNSNGVINNFISTFFLTITNPAIILAFLGIFAGLGLGSQIQSYSDSITLVIGVFFGSALWWLFLSTIVSFFKYKVTEIHLIWINKLSGLIIISFGVWAFL